MKKRSLEENYIILLFVHCLTSDTDPTGPRRLLCYRGKTCSLHEEKPYSWGRKNPMSHLSRMKNPDLPYLSIAAALWAYVLCPASLDVLATLGITASLTRTCSLCLINCCVLLLTSCILTIPCVLSFI